ncbi:MAG: hypothetical protein LBN39_10450 [Planctomycetaceae bacterium]|nr:hypothetical protein [Planctomycetaceae bacterium]
MSGRGVENLAEHTVRCFGKGIKDNAQGFGADKKSQKIKNILSKVNILQRRKQESKSPFG